MTADRDSVLRFLLRLGKLCAVPRDKSVEDVAVDLREYLPLLCRAVDAGAFCDDSLDHVARQCRFFPSYAELVEHLSAWWRDHRPRPPTISAAVAVPETASAKFDDLTDDQKLQFAETMAALRGALVGGAPVGGERFERVAVRDLCAPPEFACLTMAEKLAAYRAVAACNGPWAERARTRVCHLERALSLSKQLPP